MSLLQIAFPDFNLRVLIDEYLVTAYTPVDDATPHNLVTNDIAKLNCILQTRKPQIWLVSQMPRH